MIDQTRTLKTACRCAQFCMLRMSVCVVSLLSLSTIVSMKVLKVYLSLYTLLRSHLFVNCCIRRYSLYRKRFWVDWHRPFGFSVQDGQRVVSTPLGTRPDDPLADLIMSLAFSFFHHKLLLLLQRPGPLSSVWDEGSAIFQHGARGSSVDVGVPTYMEDVVCVQQAPVPEALLRVVECGVWHDWPCTRVRVCAQHVARQNRGGDILFWHPAARQWWLICARTKTRDQFSCRFVMDPADCRRIQALGQKDVCSHVTDHSASAGCQGSRGRGVRGVEALVCSWDVGPPFA